MSVTIQVETARAPVVTAPLALSAARAARPFFARLPAAVWLVALSAALLHIMPVARARAATPAGWEFTGNVRVSPDYMQYRVWTSEARRSGPIVRNSLTSEPNAPHLPVFFYWMVARVSAGLGLPEGFVVAGFGALFALGLTILLFCVVREFFDSPHQVWCVFAAILLGGGLGAHLRILTGLPVISEFALVKRFVTEALYTSITPEDHRAGYVVIALFDAHYLLIWLFTVAAVAACFLAIRRPASWRLGLVAALYAGVTILHVYEGVTLIAISLGVAVLCWRGDVAQRLVIGGLAAGVAAVTAALVWLGWLYHSGGLPVTHWRAPHILLSTVVIAHPVGWPVIAAGLADVWRKARFEDLFLLGWLLGCLALTLSSPFYPYPDRGMMTLAVPVLILAGRVYFRRRERLSLSAAVVVVLLMGATPLWAVQHVWSNTAFNPKRPFVFMSGDHRVIAHALQARASDQDILLAPEPDLLWLAPEHPGRHFCAHFFLTVDYARKQSEAARFYAADSTDQAAFLQANDIRFVYVSADRRPERFAAVAGLTLLASSSVGSVFEYHPSAHAAARE